MNKLIKKSLTIFLVLITIFGTMPLSGFVDFNVPDWLKMSSVFEQKALAASNTVQWNTSYSAASGNADTVDLPQGTTTFYYNESPYLNISVGGNVYVHDAYLYLYKDGSYFKTIHYKQQFPNTNYFRYWATPINGIDVGSYYFYYVLTYSTGSYSNSTGTYTTSNYSFKVIDRTPSINLSSSSVSLNLAGAKTTTINVSRSCSLSYSYYYNFSKNSSAFSCSWQDWQGSVAPITITAHDTCTNEPITISLKRSSDDAVMATRKIYVTITKPNYTISFNANGGSGAPGSVTKKYNENLTLPTIIPTRTGRTFLGWSTSSSATSATYLPGGTITSNSSATLYAVWKETTLTSGSVVSAPITYSGQLYYYKFVPSTSGTYVIYSTGSSDTKVYLYNSSGTELSSNDDGGEERNFRLSYNLTAGTTYYYAVRYYSSSAVGNIPFKFGPVYTVSYNANGGASAPSSQTKDYGVILTLSSSTPVLSGYTFKGWSTSSSATSATYQPGSTYSSNSSIILYAVWEKNTYTLTYDGNGYSEYSSNTSGQSSYTVKSPSTTRVGYTFLGWSKSRTATVAEYQPGSSIALTNNTTLYAVWKQTTLVSGSSVSTPISYGGQVYFYKFVPSKSGNYVIYSTGTVDTRVYLYNSSGTELKSDDDGGESTNFRLAYNLTAGNTYYYAVKYYSSSKVGSIALKCGPVYTISYNANKGSGAPLSQEKDYGKSIMLRDSLPVLTGHTFLGWSTSSTATAATYSSGGVYSNDADVTLYAVWNDSSSPTGSISSTNDVSSTQTVAINLNDNVGVAGYYWGTSSAYSNNTYTKFSDSSVSKSANLIVSAPGTYYLVVKDTSGNVSISYAITFYKTTLNANGGSGGTTVLTQSGSSFVLPQLSRNGYKFSEWNTNADGSGISYNGTYTVSSSKSLYALWQDVSKPTISVTSTNDVSPTQVVTFTLSDNTKVAGYYWGTSSTCSNNTYYTVSQAVQVKATQTISESGKYYLFARDTSGNISDGYLIEFCITVFDSNGGEVTPSSVITKKNNSFVLPVPEHETCTFGKWIKKADGSETAFTGSYTVTADSNLYAQWIDDSRPTARLTVSNNVSSEQTVKFDLLDNISVAGYYWGTSRTYSQNAYVVIGASSASVEVNQKVYDPGTYYLFVKDTSGNISQEYSVTFYKTVLEYCREDGKKSTILTKSDYSFALPSPERSGYTFGHWNATQNGTGNKFVGTYNVKGNATLYAVWEDNSKPTGSVKSTNTFSSYQTVTLTLKDNEGIVGYYWGTNSIYTNNSYIKLDSVSTNVSINKKIDDAGTYYLVVKDSSGNLSATCSIIFYKTTLNYSQSTVDPSVIITETGKSFTLPTPTNSEYTFKGWNSSSDGSGYLYSGEYTVSGSKTLYALWEDAVAPSGTISFTNEVSLTQTVTLKLVDNVSVAGYYWGTSSICLSNTYIPLTSVKPNVTQTQTVSNPGTYYLFVKDLSGNISSSSSVTFYKTTLNAGKGNVTPSAVITCSGKAFTLPVPACDGYVFKGWNTSSDGKGQSYSNTYIVSGNKTLYAQWEDSTKPTASLTCTNELSASQNVNILLKDNVGLAGYYWGPHLQCEDNDYTALQQNLTSDTVTKKVTSDGVYYLVVKDISGNLSEVYNVTFYKTTLNPGKGTVSVKTILTEKGKSFTLPSVSLDNYEYIGWSDKSKAEVADFVNSYTVTANKTLYAVLVSNVRVVSFDANTGSDAPESIKYDYNVGTTLPKATPTKFYKIRFNANGGVVNTATSTVYCAFDSWNVDVQCKGEKYYPEGFYTSITDATLYAQWIDPVAGNLPTPVLERKNFKGWYTEQNGGSLVTSETKITDNITLYAHWENVRSFNVTFNANGGRSAPQAQILYDKESIYLDNTAPVKTYKISYKTDGGFASATNKVVSCTFDQWKSQSGKYYSPGDIFAEYEDTVLTAQWIQPKAGKLATAEKEGYNFKGWYTDEGELVTETTVISKNITLNAKWSEIKTYTVSYDANGGVNVPSPQIKYENENLTLVRTLPNKSFVISYDANSGACKTAMKELKCSFVSWIDVDGDSYYSNSVYTKNKDNVLYANWSNPIAGELENPVKTGYRFDGWYTERTGGSQIKSNTVISSDLSLYAHWSPIRYTLNYYDGSNLISTKTMLYDNVNSVKCPVTPEKAGHSFLGWSDEPGGAVKYNEEDQIENLTDVDGAKIPLYAVWMKHASLEDLTYSFINNRDGFNGYKGFEYGENYVIGINAYRNIFGPGTYASKFYYEDVTVLGRLWGGNCFGIASTSLMFNSFVTSEMSAYDFNETAALVSDLDLKDTHNKLKFINYSSKKERDLNLVDFIEMMQVSQKCQYIQKDYKNNKDKLNELCELIKQSKTTNKYPIIALFGLEGGHAVVGYDIRYVNDQESRLYIYDSNYPETERFITLKTDSEGNCIGWNYELSEKYEWGTDFTGSWISYVPYEDIEFVWHNRGDSEKLANQQVNVMMINSQDYEIFDIAGNLIAECNDGVFESNNDNVYTMSVAEMNVSSEGMVMLPTDMYKIKNTDESIDDLKVTMICDDLGASVSTTSSEIVFAVDGKYNLNSINVGAKVGDTYQLELVSSGENQYESISLQGVGDGSQVGLSCKNQQLTVNVNNSPEVSLTINGVNQPIITSKQIKSIEVLTVPKKTVYTYEFSEELVKKGLSVLVNYTDGTSMLVSDESKLNCFGFDSMKIGWQTITVEYEGFTDTFEINVSDFWWKLISILKNILESLY